MSLNTSLSNINKIAIGLAIGFLLIGIISFGKLAPNSANSADGDPTITLTMHKTNGGTVKQSTSINSSADISFIKAVISNQSKINSDSIKLNGVGDSTIKESCITDDKDNLTCTFKSVAFNYSSTNKFVITAQADKKSGGKVTSNTLTLTVAKYIKITTTATPAQTTCDVNGCGTVNIQATRAIDDGLSDVKLYIEYTNDKTVASNSVWKNTGIPTANFKAHASGQKVGSTKYPLKTEAYYNFRGCLEWIENSTTKKECSGAVLVTAGRGTVPNKITVNPENVECVINTVGKEECGKSEITVEANGFNLSKIVLLDEGTTKKTSLSIKEVTCVKEQSSCTLNYLADYKNASKSHYYFSADVYDSAGNKTHIDSIKVQVGKDELPIGKLYFPDLSKKNNNLLTDIVTWGKGKFSLVAAFEDDNSLVSGEIKARKGIEEIYNPWSCGQTSDTTTPISSINNNSWENADTQSYQCKNEKKCTLTWANVQTDKIVNLFNESSGIYELGAFFKDDVGQEGSSTAMLIILDRNKDLAFSRALEKFKIEEKERNSILQYQYRYKVPFDKLNDIAQLLAKNEKTSDGKGYQDILDNDRIKMIEKTDPAQYIEYFMILYNAQNSKLLPQTDEASQFAKVTTDDFVSGIMAPVIKQPHAVTAGACLTKLGFGWVFNKQPSDLGDVGGKIIMSGINYNPVGLVSGVTEGLTTLGKFAISALVKKNEVEKTTILYTSGVTLGNYKSEVKAIKLLYENFVENNMSTLLDAEKIERVNNFVAEYKLRRAGVIKIDKNGNPVGLASQGFTMDKFDKAEWDVIKKLNQEKNYDLSIFDKIDSTKSSSRKKTTLTDADYVALDEFFNTKKEKQIFASGEFVADKVIYLDDIFNN